MDDLKISVKDFLDKNGHEKIRAALQMFARENAKKLPEFLIKEDREERIMLDILKVRGADVFLPVEIRSTKWLAIINRVSGIMLRYCLDKEFWPVQKRIELIGGLSEMSKNDTEGALRQYLKALIEYWKSIDLPCPVSVSSRVVKIANSDELKDFLKEVKTVELSDSYENEEVYFFD